jgi:hypothetical protein
MRHKLKVCAGATDRVINCHLLEPCNSMNMQISVAENYSAFILRWPLVSTNASGNVFSKLLTGS